MSQTINIDEVKTELGAYYRKNSKVVESMFYNNLVQLNPFCKVITGIKGKFPAMHSVMGHVIQGFAAEWNELGKVDFKVNELQAYHQKVNFPIIPAEILNSWLAELYVEGKDLKDMPISKYIMEKELAPKILDDLNILAINGEYDANNLSEFGKSMNGIVKVLTDGLANSSNPMFKVPISALTDNNMVAEITKFERAIPKKAASKIKYIFMSTNNAERYRLDYENTFGTHVNFSDDKMMKTRLKGWKIAGLDVLPDDVVFTTVDGNMRRLIDIFDKPALTDVQKLDYKLKLFFEFWLGYNFWINQLVFVANFADSTKGLGNDQFNHLYYPEDFPAPVPSVSGSASA